MSREGGGGRHPEMVGWEDLKTPGMKIRDDREIWLTSMGHICGIFQPKTHKTYFS